MERQQAEAEHRKAAEQGDAWAQFILGRVYYDLNERCRKYEYYSLAEHWYRKSAEQGYAPAQNNLGVMTYDTYQAVQWFRKAADQGEETAQYNLGGMYERGSGVSQNYAEAAQWYKKSAEQGYAPAQRKMGWMYMNGCGVSKDDVQAHQWYRLAAEQGDVRAIDYLKSKYIFQSNLTYNENKKNLKPGKLGMPASPVRYHQYTIRKKRHA